MVISATAPTNSSVLTALDSIDGRTRATSKTIFDVTIKLIMKAIGIAANPGKAVLNSEELAYSQKDITNLILIQ